MLLLPFILEPENFWAQVSYVYYFFEPLPVVADGATSTLPFGSRVLLWPWPPELTTWLGAAFDAPLVLLGGVRLVPGAGL